MKNIQKVANRLRKRIAQLKTYRKRKDDDKVEALVDEALDKNSEKDVDVSFNGQHYGWFIWNSEKGEHEQKDLNDFEKDDTIGDVREFVHSLKKIKLEDYE